MSDRSALAALALRWAGLIAVGKDTDEAEQLWAQILALRSAPADAIDIIAGADLFAPLPATPWLSEGLELAPGAPSLWAGYGFSGKTYAAQALALSVATGREAWGSLRCRPGKVLHLDFEQGRHVTLSRYQKLARGMGVGPQDVNERLSVGILPRLSLSSSGAESALRQACGGVALCVIDSFRAACPEIKEDSSEARRPLDMLTRVSEATECTMLVIHHARKPSKDAVGGVKMSIRGSSGLFDACASVFVFDGRKGEATKVSHEKARISGKPQEDFGIEVHDVTDVDGRFDGVQVVVASVPLAAASGVSRAQEGAKVQAAIVEALRGGPLGSNQLESVCRDSGLEFKAAVFRTNRDAMVEAGAIAVAPGPRRGKVYSLPAGRQ